jgi:hypothetical protein
MKSPQLGLPGALWACGVVATVGIEADGAQPVAAKTIMDSNNVVLTKVNSAAA